MFAVLFYSQLDPSLNPNNIPGSWPAEIIELHNNDSGYDDTWTIMSADELTAYKADNQAEYDAWYASFTGSNQAAATLQIVAAKIAQARAFGMSLIAEYGASNVLSGYTTDQIQQIMAITLKVQAALNTGSLYVAIAELEAIVPDEVITHAATIEFYKNQIQDYLGIPRD